MSQRMSSQPRRATVPWIVVCALLCLSSPSALSASLENKRPEGAKGTLIVPDRFLRRWDPVTIFFPSDTGPARGGPEDHPENFASLEPSHPGAFTWLDSRTLQFRPADPWPPLARFTWKASGRTATLSTLMVMPLSSLPADGAVNLETVDTITLSFPEALRSEDLARMTSIELRPLPGIGNSDARWIGQDDFRVKALDRVSLTEPAGYAITLEHPVPPETRAIVHFRLSLDDSASESFGEVSFSTVESFRVARMGTRETRYPITPAGTHYTRGQAINGGTGPRAVVIEFSSPPSPIGPVQARNLVRFTPAAPNLSVSLEGTELEITGDFEPETVYRTTLVPFPLTDMRGHTLTQTGQSELYIFFPSRPTYLKWGAGNGIVERYGPKMAPIDGRGMDRVDIRIHEIDPLDRSFWPFPADALVVGESERPPGPGEQPETFTLPERNISPSELEDHLRALGAPPVSKILSLPLRRQGSSASFGLDLEPDLGFLSGKNHPGTYLVGLRRLDASRERAWMRLQVTDLALTTIEEPRAVRFVVTSLSTGEAIAGAHIRVEGSRRGPGSITTGDAGRSGSSSPSSGPSGRAGSSGSAAAGPSGAREGSAPDLAWSVLAEGVTNSEGVCRWEAPGQRARVDATVQRIVVQSGVDTLVLDPRRAPDVYAENQWSASNDSWLQWTHAPLDYRGPQVETLVHLFTERPLYRPGEKVHIKGYLRRRQNGALTLTSLRSPYLVVNGPGEQEWRYPVTFTAAGSFYRAFSEEKAPTGDYAAHLEDAGGVEYGKVSFKIEAYRLPLFEVGLHAPERTSLDKEFEVALTASYYAGGRVAARPVQWRVTQFPYTWSPKAREGFLYSSDGRFSGSGRFESTPRLDRQDATDEEGAAKLVLNPAIEPTAQPRSYVIEATVTGVDDQTVTATTEVKALPPFVLGLEVPRYVERASVLSPRVVVVGPDDEPLAGMPVTVRLLSRQWHSHLRASDFSSGVARYITDVVDEKVSETTVVSSVKPLTVPIPLRSSGVYVVELEAHDRLGRAQVVSVDLYAGGDEPVGWRKPTTRVFEVTADKDAYDPGETAVFVLESPFQRATALAVVEAPEGNEYHWVSVEGGAATFRLPVLGTFVPRLPVHFVLMRGRVPGTTPSAGNGTDLGKPATLASTAWIKVNPVENRANVTLTFPPKARPGETIEIEVDLADSRGSPLAGEVTLWLVDQAVLALGREQKLDPLKDFITDALSHLAIRDTRNLVFGYLPFAEQPGGDAGERKGAGSLLGRTTVRRNFQTVPYYNPEIAVGPDGKAKVPVTLSDDLTVFKIRAKAACGPDRFGYATGEIAVRLPVIVQPALPRFVRPGDRFTAAAIARIVEGEGGRGSAEGRFEGLTLEGPAKQELQWTPNRPERIEFSVEVPAPPSTPEGNPKYDEVALRIGVERASDGAADAFEVKLPLRADRPALVARSLGELKPGEPLVLPPVAAKARPGTVRRSVLVSDQPALVRMAAALEFLQSYPYGCTEQRLSGARAGLALRRFRALLHERGSDERLERIVHDTIEWVSESVDPNGLVAFWPGGEGRVSLTSWAYLFLLEARDSGASVDPKVLDMLTRSLQRSLRSDSGLFIDGESWAERSWALTALAAGGKFDPGYAAELARKAQYLDLESTAEVVQAFARGGQSDSPAVPPLSEKLWKGLIVRLHQGHEIYGGLQDTPRTRSGLILASETRTLSEMVRALSTTKTSDPRLPILIDALVTLGRDDGWGDTNANSSALLALSEVLKAPSTKSPPRTVHVRFGAEARDLALGPDAPVASWTTTGSGDGQATIEGGAPSGTSPGSHPPGSLVGLVVVRAETSYVPLADGSLVEPVSQGFVVTRDMLRVEKEGKPPERVPLGSAGSTVRFQVGDVVEESVQVVNPRNRNYVAVVVPLAAGMEPLNPRLATAPPEAKPAGTLTSPPTYVSFLDDHVAFFYDSLPKGTYTFVFRTRATVPGRFTQPAASAELMYDLATRGSSPGARIEIDPAKSGESR